MDWLNLRRQGTKDATDFFGPLGYTPWCKGQGNRRCVSTAVYIDLVVILNFLVDFLLILGTNRLTGFPAGVKRSALAAAFGGLYSGMCLLPGFHFLMNTLWRLVSLGGMGILAFGLDRSAWKRCGILVLLSMALGGIALGAGQGSFLIIVLSAVGVWLLCRIGFGEGTAGREYVPIQIRYGENHVSVIALKDSGNSLRDPVTGEQVLVCGSEIAHRLTGLTQAQLRAPMETLVDRPIGGLRLIPYRAVGQPCGMLLALRFEHVKIGTRQGSALVAFAPDVIGKGDCYQALTGGMV